MGLMDTLNRRRWRPLVHLVVGIDLTDSDVDPGMAIMRCASCSEYSPQVDSGSEDGLLGLLAWSRSHKRGCQG